jgi:hypothetical protein
MRKMVRIQLEDEEWYPVATPYIKRGRNTFLVPRALYNEYEAAVKAFRAVEQKLRDAWDVEFAAVEKDE